MARYPRVKNNEAEEIYSVSTKENRNNFMFDVTNPENHPNILLFLNVFKRAKAKYKFTVYGFAIMSNHVHLLIKPRLSLGDISVIMRYVNGRFSFEYNKMHNNGGGHTWKDRFGSKILRGKNSIRNMLRYFILNPVRAGIVEDPMDHPFHLGHTIMTADEQFPAFGDIVDLSEIGKDVVEYLQKLIMQIKKAILEKAKAKASYYLKMLAAKIPKHSFNLSKKRKEQFYRYFSGPVDEIRDERKKYNLKDYDP